MVRPFLTHQRFFSLYTLYFGRFVVIFVDTRCLSAPKRLRKYKKAPKTNVFSALFGGRYKTRTCDLPHVKRMRYQLRQSSVFHRQRLFYPMPMDLSILFFSFSHKPCIRRFFRSTRGRPSSFLRLRPSRCRCRFRWSSRLQRSGRSMTTDTLLRPSSGSASL